MKIMTVLRKPMMQAALLALCTMALGTLPMLAQDTPAPAQQDQGGRRGGAGMEQRQLDMMTKQLNLTPDQVTQVKAIQDDSRKQMMAVRQDDSIQGPDKRSKMMDIRKAQQDKIRGILTDDQKPKYDEMMQKMQQRMQQRQNGGGGDNAAPPPQQ